MRPKLLLIPEPDDQPEDRINAQVEFLQAVGIAGAGASAPRTIASDTQLLSAYVNAYLDSFPVDQRPNEKSLEAYRLIAIANL